MNRIACVVLATVLAGCGQLNGNNVKGTEQRTVSSFYTLDVSGGLGASVQVLATAPDQPVLVLTGETNLLPHVVTEVRGGNLSIRTDGKSLSTNMPIVVQTSLPLFTSADLSGGSSLEATDLTGDTFKLSQSGGSTATLGGTAGVFTVSMSGGSTLDATKLTSGTVHLDLSGGSTAGVCATDRLDGSASGGSTATYTCKPETVSVDSSGGSNVTGS